MPVHWKVLEGDLFERAKQHLPDVYHPWIKSVIEDFAKENHLDGRWILSIRDDRPVSEEHLERLIAADKEYHFTDF